MVILNINDCTFAGRLTKDPELKFTTTNVPVVRFSLAVERAYQKKGDEKKVDFFDFTAWRSDAEFLCKHAQKGDVIYVKTEATPRKYEAKEGGERIDHSYTVNLGTLKIVSCKNWDAKAAANQGNGGNATRPASPSQQAPAPSYSSGDNFADLDDDDGDLPF